MNRLFCHIHCCTGPVENGHLPIEFTDDPSAWILEKVRKPSLLGVTRFDWRLPYGMQPLVDKKQGRTVAYRPARVGVDETKPTPSRAQPWFRRPDHAARFHAALVLHPQITENLIYAASPHIGEDGEQQWNELNLVEMLEVSNASCGFDSLADHHDHSLVECLTDTVEGPGRRCYVEPLSRRFICEHWDDDLGDEVNWVVDDKRYETIMRKPGRGTERDWLRPDEVDGEVVVRVRDRDEKVRLEHAKRILGEQPDNVSVSVGMHDMTDEQIGELVQAASS